MAGEIRSDPFREASKLVGRTKCVNQKATKVIARVKRIAGVLGVPSRSTLGEGRVDIAAKWGHHNPRLANAPRMSGADLSWRGSPEGAI